MPGVSARSRPRPPAAPSSRVAPRTARLGRGARVRFSPDRPGWRFGGIEDRVRASGEDGFEGGWVMRAGSARRMWAVLAVGILVMAAACADERPSGLPAGRAVAACVGADATAVHLCTLDMGSGTVEQTDLAVDPGQRIGLSPDRSTAIIVRDGTLLEVTLADLVVTELLGDASDLLDPVWIDGDTFVVWQAGDQRDTVGPVLVIGSRSGDRRRLRLDTFVPAGAVLLGGTSAAGERISQPYELDGTYGVVLVDIDAERVVDVFEDLPAQPLGTALSDEHLVVASFDDSISVVELRTGRVIVRMEERVPLVTPTFSPDGRRFAYVDTRRAIGVVDIDSRVHRVVLDHTADQDRDFPAYVAWS
jgi:hypothetical protein